MTQQEHAILRTIRRLSSAHGLEPLCRPPPGAGFSSAQGFYIEGVTVVECHSLDDAKAVLEEGHTPAASTEEEMQKPTKNVTITQYKLRSCSTQNNMRTRSGI